MNKMTTRISRVLLLSMMLALSFAFIVLISSPNIHAQIVEPKNPILPAGCSLSPDNSLNCKDLLAQANCTIGSGGAPSCENLPDGCSILDYGGDASPVPIYEIFCQTIQNGCISETGAIANPPCTIASGSIIDIDPESGIGISSDLGLNTELNCQGNTDSMQCSFGGNVISTCTTTPTSDDAATIGCSYSDPNCVLGSEECTTIQTTCQISGLSLGQQPLENCASVIKSCAGDEDCVTQNLEISCNPSDSGTQCSETDSIPFSSDCATALANKDDSYFNTYCQPPGGDYSNCVIGSGSWDCSYNNEQCVGGQLSPPVCQACPIGQGLNDDGQCADVVCQNGAVNTACDQCATGDSFIDGECVSSSCWNGATNPPDCSTCSDGLAPVGDICPGETTTTVCSTQCSDGSQPPDCDISECPTSGGSGSGLSPLPGPSVLNKCGQPDSTFGNISCSIKLFFNSLGSNPAKDVTPLPLVQSNSTNATGCNFYLVVCWIKS
jgi:hypothetical protein